MDHPAESQNTSNALSSEAESVFLMKKIQKHLVFLEKKIDALIEGSVRRPFQEKRFSKPMRSRGHHSRPPHRNWSEGGQPRQQQFSGERNPAGGSGNSGPFGQFQNKSNREFSYKKKKSFRHKKPRH